MSKERERKKCPRSCKHTHSHSARILPSQPIQSNTPTPKEKCQCNCSRSIYAIFESCKNNDLKSQPVINHRFVGSFLHLKWRTTTCLDECSRAEVNWRLLMYWKSSYKIETRACESEKARKKLLCPGTVKIFKSDVYRMCVFWKKKQKKRHRIC